MLIIKAIHLQEQGGLARDEVAFHDLGNVLERSHDVGVLVVLRQVHADESADVEPEGAGLDHHPGTGDDTVAFHLVDPLMDGGSGDTALPGNLQEWHAGVVDQVGENLPVDCVDLVICHMLLTIAFS